MDISGIREMLLNKLIEMKPETLKVVEPFTGQLSEGADFAKRMPACLVHFAGSTYEPYSRKTYNINTSYQIYIFSNIKRNKKKNINSIESIIDTTIDKILEIDQVVLKSVQEAYYDSNILAYVINIDFIPKEVL